MEKSRQKKKKKIQNAREIECFETLEDIGLSSTSVGSSIVSVECAISTQMIITDDNEKLLVEPDIDFPEVPIHELNLNEEKEDTLIPDVEEVLSPTEDTNTVSTSSDCIAVECTPTAPPVLSNALKYKHEYVKYPELQHMRNLEEEINVAKILQPSTETEMVLEPFNETQFRELYKNPQLEIAKQFENEFILTELDANYIKTNHILYEYLDQYSKIRSILKSTLFDLGKLKTVSKKNQSKLWKLEENNIQSYGNCADGVSVGANQRYKMMVFDENVMTDFDGNLKDLITKCGFQYTKHIFASEVLKLKIEQKIREISKICYNFFDIRSTKPVSLEPYIDVGLKLPVEDLRIAISILFTFLRRPMPDEEFFVNIKNWIIKLVAVQLRLATWQDHLFIMYHILRCPKGTMSWATPLIQVPDLIISGSSPFSNPRINHCITLLSALLLPIQKRNEFLEKVLQYDLGIDTLQEDVWTLIDSDGEEGHTSTGECSGFKESDLVALLNQIPLETLFSSVTLSYMKHGKYECEEDSLSGNHLLKLIALSTTLVNILGEGMINYDKERYRQFAKRLARIVRHIILYLTDVFEIFRKNAANKDLSLKSRVQVEYSSFVLRTCRCIYMSRTWQYLVDLPFSNLDLKRLWNLYYLLNVGFTDDIRENFHEDCKEKVYLPDFQTKFNDVIIEVPSDDLYYLLQTFCNMILSRGNNDWEFIRVVTQHLLEIGFLNSTTKDICYKTITNILENITTKYPEIISDIVNILSHKISAMTTSVVYIIKSLSLDRWRPTFDDFNILSNWLMNFNIDSMESSIGRMIISRINWGFDENEQLFLPHEIHLRMAFLIVEVSSKHVPEVVGTSGLSEGVRQVSNLYKNQPTKTIFTTWCWNMATKLRLHFLDLNSETIQRTLRNPVDILGYIPDFEKLPIIYQGVMESRPIALYLSIITSLCGHSIPEISYKGFIHMQLLLNDYRHFIVIRCLQLISPLFLECPEILSSCEKFQSILTQILNADRTYFKIAKEFLMNDTPGPVLQLLGNMIQAQIINYIRFGLQTPTCLIKLWLQCFTNNSVNWYKDWSVTFIIDLILKIAYQFPDAWNASKDYFRDILKKNYDGKSVKPGNFTNLFSNSAQTQVLPGVHAVWLSLLILELEHEIYEIQMGIWPEILRNINESNGKNCVENSLKKTINLVGGSSFSSASLVIYKWANFILIIPMDHPLLPIVCQQFFFLYLSRIPINEEEKRYFETFGVADKFFNANPSLMKKLKKRLIEIENYYKEESLKTNDVVVTDIQNNCSRLFRSYVLWLEETRLNKMNAEQMDLPPQYDSNRLVILFSGNSNHWTEFLYLPSIRNVQQKDASKWLKECFRQIVPSRKNSLLSPRQILNEDPKERILNRLKSYDSPVSPPIILNQPLLLEPLPNHIEKDLLLTLQLDFHLVEKYARDFEVIINEMKALDCGFKELIRELYNISRKTMIVDVTCTSKYSKTECKGAARIELKIPNSKINDIVKEHMNANRNRHDILFENQLSSPPENLILSITKTSHIVQLLIDNFNKKKCRAEPCNDIKEIGINFFYIIINDMKTFVMNFPPANELYLNVINQLGIFIKDSLDTEGIKLLNLMIKRPDLLTVFLTMFTPLETPPQSFIAIYKAVIDNYIHKCDPVVLHQIILKFELKLWIERHKPRLADLEVLLQLILTGLENWNQKNSNEIQKLFREHLMIIFEDNFPEHYGEVLQIILKSSSEQKLLPIVILDLVHSLYRRADCEIASQYDKEREKVINFANNQKFLSYKEIRDTITMLSQHYQNERLQHGIYGVYPKQKIYCNELSLLFGSLSYSVIVSAIHTYQGILAEQLIDWLWPCLCDLYSPWLVPYHPNHLKHSPSNWIQQMTSNNPILLPWSDSYLVFAQKMLNLFINCVQFLLEMLPAGTNILSHIFYWYEIHFANTAIPKQILNPVHVGLMKLPWNKFNPTLITIDSFNRIFQQFLPECHIFGGFIFLHVNWTIWITNNINTWNYDLKLKILSSLLMNFVKLSCEPHIREGPKILELLNDACNYPWYLLEYKHIEVVLDWFVMSIEPSVILKLSSEHQAVDNAVLGLLEKSCGMCLKSEENSTSTQFQSKRIIYVRSITRLLRSCGSKYQQLLTTPDGLKAFRTSVVDLLNMIENILYELYKGSNQESINLMIEIVGSLQTQGEFISKLFVDSIVIWQNYSIAGSTLLCSNFNAIGSCKKSSLNLCVLLEATINNYFRSADNHQPSWKLIIDKVGAILPTMSRSMLIQNNFLLCLHLLSIYKLRNYESVGDKITFLQELHTLLENFKTNESVEPHVALLWGLIIVCGCQILLISQNSRNHLLTLARYLQVLSTQSEGWGEGLLGAIGLKKDNISNKKRILTRCLSCIIFSLFPNDPNSVQVKPCKEYEVALDELKTVINTRKYNDIRQMALKAIETIESPNNTLVNARENVCRLIRLFYKNNFLTTLEEIWNF